MCGKAQEGKHGDPAKSDLGTGFVLPIGNGLFMVRMIFIHQSKPDIHIRKVCHASAPEIVAMCREA